MSQTLLYESVPNDPTPLKVDAEKGIIYDVKILGLKSKNRREYTDRAAERAKTLYEGAEVYGEHPAYLKSNPPQGLDPSHNPPRPLTDRVGRLEGIYHKPGIGLFAKELQTDLNHPFSKSLLWWAQKDPTKVCLSQVAVAHGVEDKARGVYVYDEIKEVRSVDVVGKGGTNRTLYESYDGMNEIEDLGQYVKTLFGDLSLDAIKQTLSANVKAVADATREFKGTVAEALSALKSTGDPRVRLVVETLDERLASDATVARRAKAKQACTDAKLADSVVTEVFIESLVRDNDANWATVIEDRKASSVARKTTPPSGLGREAGATTFDQFIANVKAGK